jgi:tubulin---tyrosine ligase
MRGYFYAEGYLRTSCREFNTKDLSNRLVHLTNDAVQKHAPDYGRFEAGNKLSFHEF